MRSPNATREDIPFMSEKMWSVLHDEPIPQPERTPSLGDTVTDIVCTIADARIRILDTGAQLISRADIAIRQELPQAIIDTVCKWYNNIPAFSMFSRDEPPSY